MRSERILAVSAVFVSVLALGVSIWQGMLSREHNRLSLAPYLQVSPRLVGDASAGLYLENAGTGSAFVKSASISVRGKNFDLADNKWEEFFEHIGVEPRCFRERWLRPGAAVLAGKEFDLIKISDANLSLPECLFETLKLLTEKDAQLNISYESSYNERHDLSVAFAIKEDDLGNFKELFKTLKKYNELKGHR
jgi:hypothetical protein